MPTPVQTEIEKKRAVWWDEHFRPDMPLEEVFQVTEELALMYPLTLEEREKKWGNLKDIPEFVF